MHDVDTAARAILALCVFTFGLAGHYLGDQWLQTHSQACKKPLNGAEPAGTAMWHCAKHVITWTAAVTAFVSLAGWWLHLPLKPGWLAAAMVFNAVTHFAIDLRSPLLWVARLLRRGPYIAYGNVVRTSGPAESGPGTALMELDQTAHKVLLAVSALIAAGPM